MSSNTPILDLIPCSHPKTPPFPASQPRTRASVWPLSTAARIGEGPRSDTEWLGLALPPGRARVGDANDVTVTPTPFETSRMFLGV